MQSVNISRSIIAECNTNQISLDELIFLYTLFIEQDWDIRIYPASLAKFVRFGLLTKDHMLTEQGELLVSSLIQVEKPVQVTSDRFEEFWEAFPKDDEHGMFPKTRAIRVNKLAAKKEYEKLLAEKVSEDTLIDCLNTEVQWRKSFTNSNFLTYLKSPANWLSNKAYLDSENYILQEPEDRYGKDVI